MITHLGPEAHLIEAAGGIAEAVRRLPRLLENLDRGAAELANGKLRLHPETIRALKGESRFTFGSVALVLVGAIIAGLFILAF